MKKKLSFDRFQRICPDHIQLDTNRCICKLAESRNPLCNKRNCRKKDKWGNGT